MIATADIGHVGANLLRETWDGQRLVELEGPCRYSPNDLAKAFSTALSRPVVAKLVPRDEWEAIFKGQGTADPSPRIEMLDGFNSSWISFEGAPALQVKGKVELATVIGELVARNESSG
jgi:uncharacterized protein YbjT (DUF2867 family)